MEHPSPGADTDEYDGAGADAPPSFRLNDYYTVIVLEMEALTPDPVGVGMTVQAA